MTVYLKELIEKHILRKIKASVDQIVVDFIYDFD